ncbi:deoxycytidylate deaminase-like [Anguilla rostrata]|uniref:deoxycytidylate deaminase-like n=1 Tax=Anguilla rostrata TaxID=7938 RepID=UPI0030CDEBCF
MWASSNYLCQFADGFPEGPSGGGTESREDYLKDSDYFMGVALLTAQRSRDPNTQVGACIVNKQNKIVATGHNDMPNRCDGLLSWKGSPENSTDKDDQCKKSGDQRKKSDRQCEQSDDQWLETKYPYVCHAELNAIMNKSCADLKGCTMHVTLFPCNDCTRLIVQAGIREVIYLSKGDGRKEAIASERLLDKAEIKHRQFEGARNPITLNFS